MKKLTAFFLLAPLLGALSVMPAAADFDEMDLPVLMYHSILKDPKRHGTYTISPAALEADLRYLSDNGYETVVVEDIVNYVENSGSLPPKPVMLTFDDGHYNNVYYAEPLLEKYGMRAVIFVLGICSERSTDENTQNPNFSYVSWDEIAAMSQRGIWDIQSHSWDLHGKDKGRMGVSRKRGESVELYKEMLCRDLNSLSCKLESVTGKRPAAFAYPLGFLDLNAEAVMRELGYKATFCSASGIARLKQKDVTTLSFIKRLLRTDKKSAENLIERFSSSVS